jgi:hypothetical protein
VTTTVLTVPEAFLAAADKIDECGWTRRTFGDCESGFCAAGALHEVTDWGAAWGSASPVEPDEFYARKAVYYSATRHAAKRLKAMFPEETWCSVTHYNDVPERTKEEVVAFLRECAETYREEPDGQ